MRASAGRDASHPCTPFPHQAGLVMEGFHQASAPDEEVPSPYTLLCMALCNLLCIDLFDGAMEALEGARSSC